MAWALAVDVEPMRAMVNGPADHFSAIGKGFQIFSTLFFSRSIALSAGRCKALPHRLRENGAPSFPREALTSASYGPEDVTLLANVLECACKEFGVEDAATRAFIARRLLLLVGNGIRDPGALLSQARPHDPIAA